MMGGVILDTAREKFPDASPGHLEVIMEAGLVRLRNDKRKFQELPQEERSPPPSPAAGAIERIVGNLADNEDGDGDEQEDAAAEQVYAQLADEVAVDDIILGDDEERGEEVPGPALAGFNPTELSDADLLNEFPEIKAALRKVQPQFISFEPKEKEAVLAVFDAIRPTFYERALVEVAAGMIDARARSLTKAAFRTVAILACKPGFKELKARSILYWHKQRDTVAQKTGKKVVVEFEADVWGELLLCVFEKANPEVWDRFHDYKVLCAIYTCCTYCKANNECMTTDTGNRWRSCAPQGSSYTGKCSLQLHHYTSAMRFLPVLERTCGLFRRTLRRGRGLRSYHHQLLLRADSGGRPFWAAMGPSRLCSTPRWRV